MKKHISQLLAILLLVALMGCIINHRKPSCTSTSDEPIVLRFGQLGDGSDGDYMTRYSRKFMELVEARTNGHITFDFFPNCQLGSEQSMLDQMIAGSLDISPLSSTVIASLYPEFYICVLPFAFGDAEELRLAEKAGAFDALSDITKDGPVRFITPFCVAFRGFSNKRHEVRSAHDINGLALRIVAGEIYADSFNALGATTSTITFSEIYTALQQGVIDAEDNTLNYSMQYKFYELEPYHTELNMFMGVNPLMISETAMNKITDDEYRIIVECAKEVERFGDEEYRKILKEAESAYIKAGGQLVRHDELTPEEMQSFKNKTRSVWDKYAARLPATVYKPYAEARKSVGLD